MRILVIGQGGREHAIVWKLAQSPRVSKLYCAPGNPGIAELATVVNINELDFAALAQFVKEEEIDLTFVGPEVPLFEGIVDFFSNRGLRIFGPTQRASRIEGSKSFAKQLMYKYNIPTAAYASFTDYDEAVIYVESQGTPIVIKADGLAAGKGVIVAKTFEEATDALNQMLKVGTFGDAGAEVVIEEFLEGEELTLLSFVDGETIRPMVPAQDHKAAFDGDQGPNTGGMGTYSPLPHITQEQLDAIVKDIIIPTVKGMKAEDCPFSGVLYTGLMLTKTGPKVIEFNARFGDPETQVVLPRLKSDLVDIIESIMDGGLDEQDIQWSDEAVACVIMASGGYPGSYEKGIEITGLKGNNTDNVFVFHAGTKFDDEKIVTNGGRVLGVVAIDNHLDLALNRAYEKINHIHFDHSHYRTDIGHRAITKFK